MGEAVISLRAYARRRDCSLRAVQRAISDGRLVASVTKDEKGAPKISDPELADREWERSTKAEYVPFSVKHDAPAPPSANTEPALADSRARRERLRADREELELGALCGKFVVAADVERELATRLASTRAKLLGVPQRLKARRPNLSLEDIAMADQLIREALSQLATTGGSVNDEDE